MTRLLFFLQFCHIVVQVSLDDEPIKFFSIYKISLCLDNSPRSQCPKLSLIILIFSCVFINFDVFYEISLKILCFVDIYTYLCTYQQTKIANFMAKLSLRQRVLEMKIGERIVVPVKEHAYTTIRSYASDLGFATGRTYSTSRNREERTYTIIRRS